ncbi:GGDEF domain-containing protein [Sulfurimonas sp. C5]|uniref:GGDEF domain-containing protein n=1 Tax=Sulfurimonas sp. C5 TaxID=3036947 RepID=UPI00245654A3|nr:GGDEF domain-containing protein [Sulfurimonas sp. C5]MDH4944191.1 GGDEF domain-containing protein [Sulfurimonas sp. C5]
MKKDELKSLVTQLYNDLIDNIDAQESPNKDQVAEYLQDAVLTIQSLNENQMDTIEHAQQAFTNAYKIIAEQGISSYQETNNKFLDLTEKHQANLEEYKNSAMVDSKVITEKFDELHQHMTFEVKRANSVIENLHARIKELEENSQLDSLTKTYNRRAFNLYLTQLCDKEKIQEDMHFLILDIDDFKNINDTYGHVAGDKVLIFITNLLKKTLRDGDKIFRYGGEEFVIILNRIDNDSCLQIAHRILKLVSSNKLIYKGTTLQVTVSIGSTKFHEGDTPVDLLERADMALYRSKKNGKNQMNTEIK